MSGWPSLSCRPGRDNESLCELRIRNKRILLYGPETFSSTIITIMKHVVILGRGGAGKSTLATLLSKKTKLPLIELDEHFWRPGLVPTPHDEWIETQEKLAEAPQWIMDGDLGKYDVLSTRLKYADTILILDFSLLRCAFRAMRRSRERIDFWVWLINWRRQSKPSILHDIRINSPTADITIFRSPKELERFIAKLDTII
jgi:hypothetical protein